MLFMFTMYAQQTIVDFAEAEGFNNNTMVR